jgi:hypothetical protein
MLRPAFLRHGCACQYKTKQHQNSSQSAVSPAFSTAFAARCGLCRTLDDADLIAVLFVSFLPGFAIVFFVASAVLRFTSIADAFGAAVWL